MSKINVDPAILQFQQALQTELDQAYPALEGSSNTRYHITLSNPNDPIDHDGTIAIIAEIGTARLDQVAGIYYTKEKFRDFATLTHAVFALVTARKELQAMAELSETLMKGIGNG